MKIDHIQQDGYISIHMPELTEFTDFYAFARQLEQVLQIAFIEKTDGLDSLYWDFIFQDSLLCLHYNVYLATSIYPKDGKDADAADNESVWAFCELLTRRFRPTNQE